MAWSLLDGARVQLRMADLNVDLPDEASQRAAAFCVQQSIEMSLKYLCEVRGIAYPKTHQISLLLMKLGKDDRAQFSFLEMYASLVTEWEATVRYTSAPFEEHEILKEVLAVAHRVVSIVGNITDGCITECPRGQLRKMDLE